MNFEIAEQIIWAMGHEPVNPFKLRHKKDATWEDYMRKDIRELTKCAAIWMLPDWQDSRGARMEHRISRQLLLKIIYQRTSPQLHHDGYHRIVFDSCSMAFKNNQHVHI